MGLDLKLLPMERWFDGTEGNPGWGYSHSVLSLDRHQALFDRIGLLDAKELEDNVPSYVGRDVPDGSAEGETMYGVMTTTPWGDPITWVTAGELAAVDWSDTFPWNNAVHSFLRALPATTRVILWWC